MPGTYYYTEYKALPMRASAPTGRALCSFLQSTSAWMLNLRIGLESANTWSTVFVRRENDRGFDGEAVVARTSAQLICGARISAQLI
eukprot:COSAG05_NODE_137_length_16843_cov_121.090779_10_plen_87_part_00